MSNVRGSEASYILAKWRCCKAHDPALASYQTCSGTTWPSPCHHHCEPIPSVTHSLVTATRRDSIQQQGSLLFGISGVCAVSMCTSSIASGAHTWTTPPYPHTTVTGRKATLLMVKSPSMWPLREAIRTASEVWRTFLGNTWSICWLCSCWLIADLSSSSLVMSSKLCSLSTALRSTDPNRVKVPAPRCTPCSYETSKCCPLIISFSLAVHRWVLQSPQSRCSLLLELFLTGSCPGTLASESEEKPAESRLSGTDPNTLEPLPTKPGEPAKNSTDSQGKFFLTVVILLMQNRWNHPPSLCSHSLKTPGAVGPECTSPSPTAPPAKTP